MCVLGGTNWNDDLIKARAKAKADSDSPVFNYAHYMGSGGLRAFAADITKGIIPDDPTVAAAIKAKSAHPSLSPHGVIFRECRDSAVHPEAVPIVITLDVTGSMSEVPRIVQAKLPALMGLLIRKGFLDHPAICIMAIGDQTSDRVPLQVGQFEAGAEIEDNLTNLYLEGGGGGHITESYELGLYFVARHTVTDHWEKRGSKGYLFVIGDEIPYASVNPDQVKSVMGEMIGEAISTSTIVEELREKWEMFFVLPKMTNHWKDKAVLGPWNKLLPQRVIELEDPNAICEAIAAQIGLFEGRDNIVDDLADAGVDRKTATAVGRALVPAGAVAAKGSVQTIPASGAASGLVKF